MQQTGNLKLNKLELADSPADITVLNPNWDKIDDELNRKRYKTIDVENANLNELLADKSYACSGTMSNAPIPCSFCIVQAFDTGAEVSGVITQVCYVPLADHTVRTFVRSVANGTTFGKWNELATVNKLESACEILKYYIDENQFSVISLAKALNNGLLWLLIELFENTVDIDVTKNNGQYVVDNYHDTTKHAIIKNDDMTVIFQSVAKVCTKTNNNIWVYPDWEGTGTLKVEISRNNGATFTEISSDTLTSISSQSTGASMICRLTMTGQVTLKNIAWGCK